MVCKCGRIRLAVLDVSVPVCYAGRCFFFFFLWLGPRWDLDVPLELCHWDPSSVVFEDNLPIPDWFKLSGTVQKSVLALSETQSGASGSTVWLVYLLGFNASGNASREMAPEDSCLWVGRFTRSVGQRHFMSMICVSWGRALSLWILWYCSALHCLMDVLVPLAMHCLTTIASRPGLSTDFRYGALTDSIFSCFSISQLIKTATQQSRQSFVAPPLRWPGAIKCSELCTELHVVPIHDSSLRTNPSWSSQCAVPYHSARRSIEGYM